MKRWIEKHFGKAWMLLVYLFLYTPLLFMVVFSFNSTRQDANFTGFSLRWYEALTRDTKIVEGFWLSLPPLCWCATVVFWGARCSLAW